MRASRRQRIGLSATQRPLDEIARFLGGFDAPADGSRRPVARSRSSTPACASRSRSRSSSRSRTWARWARSSTEPGRRPGARPRPVAPVDLAGHAPPAARAGRSSTARRSIFVNARRLAERLATRLNELAADGRRTAPAEADGHGRPPSAGDRAGQGPPRLAVARAAAADRGRAQVRAGSRAWSPRRRSSSASTWARSTSSSRSSRPARCPAGLQRIGRAGHQVGEPSRGKVFPKHRGDLRRGGGRRRSACTTGSSSTPATPATRSTCSPSRSSPCARSTTGRSTTWPRWCGGRPTFAELSDDVLARVLDLLAGRYPSDEFAELRPRIVWDRVDGVVRGRAGAAAARGHQRRHHPRPRPVRRVPARRHPGRRARRGDGLREPAGRDVPARRVARGASRTSPTSGSSSPRRRASPARCRSGTATARAGRSSSGRALGEFVREIRAAARADGARAAARRRTTSTSWPAANLLVLPRRAGRGHRRGARRPHDRGRALPRRDRRLADLRALAVRRPGARAVGHGAAGPAGRAVGHRRRAHVERRRHRAAPARGGRRAPDRRPAARPRRDRRARRRPAARHRDVRRRGSASARPGRCCCPAAGPTGARRCGSSASRRPTCWRWRPSTRRSRSCSRPPASASTTCSTCRRCARCSRDLRSPQGPRGRGRHAAASPFAQSLLFGWIAVYMYEGDAPLAERRAAALALDRDLLRELLGAEELRELLDPVVLADLELELQRLVDGPPGPRRRRGRTTCCACSARSPRDELDRRGAADGARPADRRARWLAAWSTSAGPSAVGIAGEERFAAAEDAGRLRDALGLRHPGRACPAAFTDPVDAPLDDLVGPLRPHARPVPRPRGRRPASASTPSGCGPCSTRWRPTAALVRGEFRPDGVEREWCDDDVLRQLRRRSLAALRREVEPVDAAALARFLPAWQGVGAAPARARRPGRGHRRAAGRGAPGVGARDRRPAGPRGRLPPGRPRRALHRGRGGVGRRRRRSGRPTAGCGCSSATRSTLLVPAARRATSAPDGERARRAAGPPRRRGARRSGPTSSPRSPPPEPPYDDADRARRAVGPGLGRRGHQRLARPAAGLRGRRPPAGAPAGRGRRAPAARPRPGRLVAPRPAGRRRALVAGGHAAARRCRVRLRPRPPRSPTPGPCSCSSATACSPARRRSARASRAASPASTRCSRRSRSAARSAAATSWPGSAPPSSPCPGAVDRLRSARDPRPRRARRHGRTRRRHGRRGRPGRHRPGPALRRRAAVARPPTAARRGRRRATSCWSTARPRPTSRGAAGAWSRSPPPTATRRAEIVATAGPTRSLPWSGRAAAARSSSPRSTAPPPASHPTPTPSAPPASPTATGASSSAPADPPRTSPRRNFVGVLASRGV